MVLTHDAFRFAFAFALTFAFTFAFVFALAFAFALTFGFIFALAPAFAFTITFAFALPIACAITKHSQNTCNPKRSATVRTGSRDHDPTTQAPTKHARDTNESTGPPSQNTH